MIEVRARPDRPLGMTPARFLADHWQKKPLLVRGAFAGFSDPTTPDDLAGLACEAFALSRLIVHEAKRHLWSVRSGPFAETDFAKLPKRDWTLLVQDVDKWDADVAALLASFAFLPPWRIDDIMVSYAVDGGSVGAHVDQYDVFLVQGLGRRRWQIDADANPPRDFRDDVELKLLRTFAPSHEWTLERGDMLYLPPGVPHHGVAIGECMTYSVGMRAPSQAELMLDFAETFAETLSDDARFADPDLEPADGDGEIDDDAFERALRAMPWLAPDRGGAFDRDALRRWFLRFVTRYRSAHAAMPRRRPIGDSAFESALERGAEAFRNPWSRAAWIRVGRDAVLSVAGAEWTCSVAFARNVSGRAPIALSAIKAPRDRNVLRSLVDAGHVTLAVPRAVRSRR
jgi:50S ribosomal protein L16 3-hydroxylase